MVLAKTGGRKSAEEILGVHLLSSRATIRQVFHRRARKLHPDRMHEDVTAEERAEANARFQKLHTAYKELEETVLPHRMHKTVEEEAYYEAVAQKVEAEEQHMVVLRRATATARSYAQASRRVAQELMRTSYKDFCEAMEPFERAVSRAEVDWIDADVNLWKMESPQCWEAVHEAEREAQRKSQTEDAPSQAEQDVSEDFEERGRFEPERLFAFAAFREFRDDFCEVLGKVGSLIFAS
eukprot:gb/GFBE01080737.1/.p1 GENE.gb/GFBE01080737.1/~~gb/GFBE01080737.1/.p1  ORF type:complete len:238 (+),score=52.64 gb/GFBE01080737.1/:1-714(+)